MKIVFVKYTAEDAGNPTAGNNIERVNWIARGEWNSYPSDNAHSAEL